MDKLIEIIRRIRTRDWWGVMALVYIGGIAILSTMYYLLSPVTPWAAFAIAIGGIFVHVFVIVLGIFTLFHIKE